MILTTIHLSFIRSASLFIEVSPLFTELPKVTDLLAEFMDLGVFLRHGELNATSLCELFVLPFDSSQAFNLASMSTFSFGVSCF